MNYQRAWTVFDLELGQLFTPYYDAQSHALSLGHPLAHAAHVVVDTLIFMSGIALLAASACSPDTDETHDISAGLAIYCSVLVLDAINCPLSTLSFALRTLSSAGPDRYMSQKIKVSEPKNMMWILQRLADNTIHENTYKF